VIDWGQLHGRFRGDKRRVAKASDSEKEEEPQSSAA
jgi:hypothetical protein